MTTATAAKITAALGALLLLAGCANGPTSGTIQDKKHDAGGYITIMQCSAYSPKGGCSVYIPIQQYVAPSWAFDLYEGSDHGWHLVTEDVYNQHAVGDYYSEE